MPPFDGPYYQFDTTTTTIVMPRKRRNYAKYAMGAVLSVLVLGALSGMIEIIFPDRGPVTLFFYGPSILSQNLTAYSVLQHAHRLKFSVGNHSYQIVTPNHDLTSDEQIAWLGFAKWKGYPTYSADGPLAIDP
jgi:hypothetical protein